MKNACVFDLDGTLLNTLGDMAVSANRTLARLGFPPHLEEKYVDFIGHGLKVLLQRICPEETPEEIIERGCSIFNEEYSKNWKKKTEPYPEILQCLKQLEQRDIALAILSNKPHQFISSFVDHFFPDINFSFCFGHRKGTPKKPAPDSLNEIIRLLNRTPEEILYVGDSAVDMQTGKNARVFTIGVRWGFRPVSELREFKADAIIASPLELLDYISR